MVNVMVMYEVYLSLVISLPIHIYILSINRVPHSIVVVEIASPELPHVYERLFIGYEILIYVEGTHQSTTVTYISYHIL